MFLQRKSDGSILTLAEDRLLDFDFVHGPAGTTFTSEFDCFNLNSTGFNYLDGVSFQSHFSRFRSRVWPFACLPSLASTLPSDLVSFLVKPMIRMTARKS